VKYDPNATCPKCGGKAIATIFCKGLYSSCPIYFQGVCGDHLDRACLRCHYQWVEETLDAPASGPT
jgi:ribosomal protein S27AE